MLTFSWFTQPVPAYHLSLLHTHLPAFWFTIPHCIHSATEKVLPHVRCRPSPRWFLGLLDGQLPYAYVAYTLDGPLVPTPHHTIPTHTGWVHPCPHTWVPLVPTLPSGSLGYPLGGQFGAALQLPLVLEAALFPPSPHSLPSWIPLPTVPHTYHVPYMVGHVSFWIWIPLVVCVWVQCPLPMPTDFCLVLPLPEDRFRCLFSWVSAFCPLLGAFF